jgi:putative flippase GtrA
MPTSQDLRPADGGRRGNARRELLLAIRAGSSSIASTLVDGTIYQLVLIGAGQGSRRYMLAALVGGLFGAVTNFIINRYWTFRATHKPIGRQAMHFLGAAATTNFSLQVGLVLLVEVVRLNPRLAWVPAKVAVWALVSYPLARFFVFRPQRPSVAGCAESPEPVPEA